MVLEERPTEKALIADAAGEIAGQWVVLGFRVLPELEEIGKGGLAVRAVVDDAVLRLDVIGEVARPAVRSVALLARVRFLAFVDVEVVAQGFRCYEGFLTEITAVRPFLLVNRHVLLVRRFLSESRRTKIAIQYFRF